MTLDASSPKSGLFPPESTSFAQFPVGSSPVGQSSPEPSSVESVESGLLAFTSGIRDPLMPADSAENFQTKLKSLEALSSRLRKLESGEITPKEAKVIYEGGKEIYKPGEISQVKTEIKKIKKELSALSESELDPTQSKRLSSVDSALKRGKILSVLGGLALGIGAGLVLACAIGVAATPAGWALLGVGAVIGLVVLLNTAYRHVQLKKLETSLTPEQFSFLERTNTKDELRKNAALYGFSALGSFLLTASSSAIAVAVATKATASAAMAASKQGAAAAYQAAYQASIANSATLASATNAAVAAKSAFLSSPIAIAALEASSHAIVVAAYVSLGVVAAVPTGVMLAGGAIDDAFSNERRASDKDDE